jgi:hypothetical protein
VTASEGQRLGVSENRVLRRKERKKEVTDRRGKTYEELRVARVQEKKNAHRVLVRKLFGRTSLEQENNIKCDLKETGWVAVDGFIWFRIREVAEHGNRPSGSMKCDEKLSAYRQVSA